jgi:hypothetical protein
MNNFDDPNLDQEQSIYFHSFSSHQGDNDEPLNILNWNKDYDKRDENSFEEYQYQNSIFLNKEQKSKQFTMENISNKITKPNTLTFTIKRVEENDLRQNDDYLNSQTESKLLTKKGRKKKDVSIIVKSTHNKFKEDNIMRKIKNNLLDFIVNKFNSSLSDKTKKLLKIDKYLSENLNRDYNIVLMERTLLDIFMKTKISKKYKRTDDKYYNVKLIRSILNENIEKKVIDLLDLKLIDMINYIKEHNLDKFLAIIEKKEKKIDGANSEKYMALLKGILIDYKGWFKNKRGRVRKKIDIKEKK